MYCQWDRMQHLTPYLTFTVEFKSQSVMFRVPVETAGIKIKRG